MPDHLCVRPDRRFVVGSIRARPGVRAEIASKVLPEWPNSGGTMKQVVESVIKTLLQEYGDEWLSDGDANERFVAESHIVLSEVDGAHLIGDPSVEDGRVKINIWVDETWSCGGDCALWPSCGRLCSTIPGSHHRQHPLSRLISSRLRHEGGAFYLWANLCRESPGFARRMGRQHAESDHRGSWRH